MRSLNANTSRKEATAADVVVVNHHLLFADIELKESGFAELLPEADVVVLDEAHKVPDIASLFFSRSISTRQISMFCQDCSQAVQKEASDMLVLTSDLERLDSPSQINRTPERSERPQPDCPCHHQESLLK